MTSVLAMPSVKDRTTLNEIADYYNLTKIEEVLPGGMFAYRYLTPDGTLVYHVTCTMSNPFKIVAWYGYDFENGKDIEIDPMTRDEVVERILPFLPVMTAEEMHNSLEDDNYSLFTLYIWTGDKWFVTVRSTKEEDGSITFTSKSNNTLTLKQKEGIVYKWREERPYYPMSSLSI